MTAQHPATTAQITASNPRKSTWLAANAGSGKTRVLTDRVALLLLEGTNPQNILCLTYTKAAASEMQNRLFKRLGAWAMMPDADLRVELATIGATEFTQPEKLNVARTLFAKAIETPGGLRIQTIHSFCSALLRRFPLEAGVSPLFQEMDDRQSVQLRDEILADIAQGQNAHLLEELSTFISDQDFAGIVNDVTNNRHAFAQKETLTSIKARFGVSETSSLQEETNNLLSPVVRDLISALISAANASSTNDKKLGALLQKLNFDRLNQVDRDILYKAFLFSKGTKVAEPFSPKYEALTTKSIRKDHQNLFPALDSFMEKVAALRELDNAHSTASNTFALYQFAQGYLCEYAALKTKRGWLDFDDLISKTESLLTNKAVADWVMYRLDGGIDHILVDEAQDTSPAQWRVIRLLAREFGQEIDSDRMRTLFVVGDKKQSIYSFQGADPEEFDRMHSFFADQLAASGQSIQGLSLRYSFRSAPIILRLVDQVFSSVDKGGFLDTEHAAFHSTRAGRVDIWPLAEKPPKPPEKEWFDTTHIEHSQNDKVALANSIAEMIHDMIGRETIEGQNRERRPVHAGDILILVQKRTELFDELIRACKALGLPIAGADRMRIDAELAVADLCALLKFLALPQDDLSLATALRSPIFGLSEQELFSLAHGRGPQNLWPVLQERRDEFPGVVGELDDLLSKADFFAPYEILERILSNFGGRIRLLERLGQEAEEGIDELLNLARTYDTIAPASLTGFLGWLEKDDTNLKRQVETAGKKLRIMTTHGAKGLEAPIVILPETFHSDIRKLPMLTLDPQGKPFWRSSSDKATSFQKNALAHLSDKNEEERLRLFYVAMTRAEQWLILCGSSVNAKKDGSWHKRAWEGLTQIGGVQIETPFGDGLRAEEGDWPLNEDSTAESDSDPKIEVPTWARETAKSHIAPKPLLKPSEIGGDKVIATSDAQPDGFAAERGNAIHHLLETWDIQSGDDFRHWAGETLAQRFATLGSDHRNVAIDQAEAVFANNELAWLFAENSLAEVTVSTPTNAKGHTRLFGIIDRLIVEPDRVVIVDFKSNAEVPASPAEVPDGIVDQLAAYASAIRQIYGSRKVETAVLWTSAPSLMFLPHNLVMERIEMLNLS